MESQGTGLQKSSSHALVDAGRHAEVSAAAIRVPCQDAKDVGDIRVVLYAFGGVLAVAEGVALTRAPCHQFRRGDTVAGVIAPTGGVFFATFLLVCANADVIPCVAGALFGQTPAL